MGRFSSCLVEPQHRHSTLWRCTHLTRPIFSVIVPVMASKAKFKLHQVVDEAINGAKDVTLTSVPATVNGQITQVVSVRENIVKIQSYDPIQFLCKVMADGMMPVSFVTEDGEVKTQYVPVHPNKRIEAAKFLAGKIMPTMQMVKVLNEGDKTAQDTADDAFAQMVKRISSS